MARKDGKDRGLFSYLDASGREFFGVRIWVHGRAHKWQGFTKKTDARDWYQDRRKDVRENRPFPARGPQRSATLEAAIADYLAQSKNKKNYKGECTYGRFWTTRLGRYPLASLTREQVDATRTHLLTVGAWGKPQSHATVNRYVAWLHHVCQRAVDHGLLETNPCRIKKFTERPAPEVEFTQADDEALSLALGDQADYPFLAMLTGLRQGEQFHLRWDDLDLAKGFGKIRSPKGGSPQVFLINAEAHAIFLRLQAQAGGSVWVFPNPLDPTLPRSGKAWYKNHFKPAAKRAGIVLSRKDGKTYHTLRHTFASRLQQRGVEVKDIKDLGRWKSWKAMDRYLKRDTSRLRSAIEKLGTAHQPPVENQSSESVNQQSP